MNTPLNEFHSFSFFCHISTFVIVEALDFINILSFNFFLAVEPANFVAVSIKIDVLCYAGKDHPMKCVISKLIIPGLGDQLTSMKKAIMPNISKHHSQVSGTRGSSTY